MNPVVLAVALVVIIQGCASVDRERGQKFTCVSTHARVGDTSTHQQAGVEYRIVELHPNDPRCGGAKPVVAVVEPTSAAVREEARREEQARQEQAAREREAELSASRRRNHEKELACISAGGTWRKATVDLSNSGDGECEARSQSRSLNCETYKMGDRVYTDCR